MKNLFKKMFLLLDNKGMATLNAVNYAKTQDNAKVEPGEDNSHKRGMYDSYTLQGAVLAANDEINSLKLPEGALITGAWIKSPSLGTTGIVSLGLRAHTDYDGNSVSEDANGLVDQADAGGQAVKKDGSTEALIGSKIGKGGAQAFIFCDEVSTNDDVKIEWHIEYLIP